MAPSPAKRTNIPAITRRDLAALFAVTAVAAGQSTKNPEPAADPRKRFEENRALLNAVELPMRIEPAFVFKP